MELLQERRTGLVVGPGVACAKAGLVGSFVEALAGNWVADLQEA
jgi:hypothetical protein